MQFYDNTCNEVNVMEFERYDTYQIYTASKNDYPFYLYSLTINILYMVILVTSQWTFPNCQSKYVYRNWSSQSMAF